MWLQAILNAVQKHSYNTTNAVNAPRNTQGAHTLQEGKHRVYTTNDEG